ncbi:MULTISPECIES: methylmalonyl Co-A mutase-associated GTPase MeaB [unclassified Bacillus (in: firmicutes)]|uniref:methylmalonyl Co-A mutase-associated GTPase MeaB n=1 Tax=unclassified Bacillus (in: firmicutes) TaxID=185979 RepID=UPI001BE53E0A|nr:MULTISPECIES: methylmalonyl Co-A mutase-associated GTPase MeaB [unclassified Bacillus (in: firmicutes)]MBT2640249.1 methylmalonyl Co-A mutase-associated GTPase MeaB [Bacillus sp. ISL-39]MBT2660895.1 methylmalonyl Co-A mutase-associated GTPase MeaB [Bacillus sp. ISL-45]
MPDEKKPEWFDPNKADSFSSVVKPGVAGVNADRPAAKAGRFVKKKKTPSLDPMSLADEIKTGGRTALAKGITLIESNAEHDFQTAQTLLHKLLPESGSSIRIGITGVPGAGKSTFIESFGSYLCDQGKKVAVLAVDPTSSLTGGSILGDKTRMEKLARNPRAFIRPSPSGGKLGGVHRKTRETMLLCEAAGFDVILVETVGVGQSEVIVRDMVDFFMLLVLTGAGDELQGMKKGIMELADAVIVNKADGPNEQSAKKTKEEYNRILHFLQPATKGWQTAAMTSSAIHNKGIGEIWETITAFERFTKKSGIFDERRRLQTKEWLNDMIIDQLQMNFFQHPSIKSLLPKVENEVISGNRPVASGVEELFRAFFGDEN